MENKDLIEIGEQVAKRGRPKGSKDTHPRPGRPDLHVGNKELTASVMSQFIRQARTVANLPPIDISDIAQVQERIDWYLIFCEENGTKPTMNGLCNCLGIDQKTIYRWEIGEYRADTHQAVIVKYKRLLQELWEMEMLEGKINPVVGIFLGKNHFGYADQQEVIVTPNNPLGELDTKGLKERYMMESIPELDEADIAELPGEVTD